MNTPAHNTPDWQGYTLRELRYRRGAAPAPGGGRRRRGARPAGARPRRRPPNPPRPNPPPPWQSGRT